MGSRLSTPRPALARPNSWDLCRTRLPLRRQGPQWPGPAAAPGRLVFHSRERGMPAEWLAGRDGRRDSTGSDWRSVIHCMSGRGEMGRAGVGWVSLGKVGCRC